MTRSAPLVFSLLLGGCSTSASLGDDPLTEPPVEADDDDDVTEEEPLAGDWLGVVNGAVVYDSRGNYPCEGDGGASVDEDDRATGGIECTFPHIGEVCTFSFEDFRVDGGQRPTTLDECFGDGEATYSLWAANGQLYGRVQRLEAQLFVEISWAFNPDVD